LPGTAIRIADDGGHALEERRIGRIEFRSPSATRGYLNNPNANAKLFDDGWLDTGDLGYLAEGDLFITGRAKDMIIRGGHNLHPYELEEAVGALAGIRKGCVAVIGVAAPEIATERVVVLAETRETEPERRAALESAIQTLAIERLGGPADQVVLAPPGTVLKTSSGKIRRAATRELFEQGLVGAPRPTVWRQLARLTTRATAVRVRRALVAAGRTIVSVYVWAAFLIAGIATLALTYVPGVALRRRAVRALGRVLAPATGIRITAVGLEHLPRDAAYIGVVNHASYVDALVLATVLPPPYAFVAKGEYRNQWLMARLLRGAGTHFVDRLDVARGIEDTRALTQAMRAGESLVFFPEGTFFRPPGLRGFRLGAFVVAAESGAAVVPIALRGTRAVFPANDWRIRPGRVTVEVLPPVRPDGTDWSAAVRLRDRTRAAILAKCGEPDTT
jgi:1-acyl-sn-glycerol-3-phosphate acyltransferase